MKTSKLVYMSLLVSMALVLSLVEKTMPLPFTTPGAKLGLANLVTVISIYTLDNYKDCFIVVILRIILSAMMGGNMSSLLYSISGAILSFLASIIIKTLGESHVSVIGVSASSAIFHNLGQLFVASLILENSMIFLYLPMLSFIGVFTGIFVGVCANYLLLHINKLPYFKNQLLTYKD